MAVQITDENFNEYFAEAMNTHGKAVDNEEDVPTVEAADVIEEEDAYSLPLVKQGANGAEYEKVPFAGSNGLVEAVAEQVATEGMLLAITEEDFNEIFND